MLTIIDEFTRECLAIEVARRLGSDDVLHRLAEPFIVGCPLRLAMASRASAGSNTDSAVASYPAAQLGGRSVANRHPLFPISSESEILQAGCHRYAGNDGQNGCISGPNGNSHLMQFFRRWCERQEPSGRLGRWGHVGLVALVGLIVVFFAVTLHRQAFSHWRKGDLGVYFRAGWAARTGGDLYAVTDDHGWHYIYPPLLASLMMPLADPPHDAPAGTTAGMLPYWASAAIWYWFNVLCTLASFALLAAALEAAIGQGGRPPWRDHGLAWWALRVWPFLLIAFPIGDSLSSGQTTALVLLLLSAAGAAMLRGHRRLAGFLLGFVGIMKLFPLYMLLYPVLRRDRPMLIGAAGGVLLALLLPIPLMGPQAALTAYRELVSQRLLGEAAGNGNAAVTQELHGTNSRIQSFEYILYDSLNPDPARRAPVPPAQYFYAHIAIAGVLTVAILWSMRRRGDPLAEFLLFSALALAMIPILPVSRPHYYALAALAFAGLYAAEWPRRRGLWPGWPTTLLGFASIGAGFLAALNERLAVDFGLATYTGLAVAAAALLAARRRSKVAIPEQIAAPAATP